MNYVFFDPAFAWIFAQACSRKKSLDILKANFPNPKISSHGVIRWATDIIPP